MRHDRRRKSKDAKDQPLQFMGEMAHEDSPATRALRLNHLIFDEIKGVLSYEIADPVLEDVRPITVELSADGSTARCRYILATDTLPDKNGLKDIAEGLERANGFIRTRVAEALNIKRVPTLRFTFDRDFDAGVRSGTHLEAGMLTGSAAPNLAPSSSESTRMPGGLRDFTTGTEPSASSKG